MIKKEISDIIYLNYNRAKKVRNVNGLADERSLEIKNPAGLSSIFVKSGGVLLGTLALGAVVFFLIKEQNFSAPISITTAGSTQKIVLPDSSYVTLNRNSEVVFPRTYKGNSREVYLKGEGFFKVTHHEGKPFIVHTQLADVRVLGTSFNVQLDKNHIEIGVAEGKVLVMTPTDSSFVEAGSTAKYESESLKIKRIVNENNWGYATQKFTFKNTSLRDVLATIEKSTAYSFQSGNSMIENCELTATFENISTEKMVNLIAESLDLTVTKNGSVFTLQGEGCQ